MPADTDIVNVALRMIGASRITSLTAGTKNSNVANDIYDEVRLELLRHPWNFAIKRKKLAQSSTTPSFEFDYAYPVPSDWVMSVSVHDNDAGLSTIFHREENNDNKVSILTSSDQVYIRYVADIKDPNLMSASFRRAFASALARDMALPLGASNTMYQEMRDQAARDLIKAKSDDAMGGFPERRPRGSWVNSRGGWRNGRGTEGI